MTPDEIDALRRELETWLDQIKADTVIYAHAWAQEIAAGDPQCLSVVTQGKGEAAALSRALDALTTLQQEVDLRWAREEIARLTAERLAFATAHAEAEADAARLREALEELDAHCEYALNTTGLRTAPPKFVPSAAKLVRGIVRRALAPSTETRE